MISPMPSSAKVSRKKVMSMPPFGKRSIDLILDFNQDTPRFSTKLPCYTSVNAHNANAPPTTPTSVKDITIFTSLKPDIS